MAVADEWWERAGDRWRAWLGANPVRAKALLVLEVVAVEVVVVARIVVDGFGRGVEVWLACALMLLGWLAVAPTKTLRWASSLPALLAGESLVVGRRGALPAFGRRHRPATPEEVLAYLRSTGADVSLWEPPAATDVQG